MLLSLIFTITIIAVSIIIGFKSKTKRRIEVETTASTISSSPGIGDIEGLDLAFESLICKCSSDLDRLCRDSSSSSAAVELLPYREQLEGVLEARLSLAVDRWDHPTILRFVNLFKPLGLEMQGLQIFVSYLRKVVSTRAADRWVQLNDQPNDNNEANYEACLRNLLQDIVSAVEDNDGILRDLCGEEGIAYAICELHKECDSRGFNILKKFMDLPVYSYIYKLHDLREIKKKHIHLPVDSANYKRSFPGPREIELHIQDTLPLAQLCEDYLENMKSKIRSLTDPELESKAKSAILMGYFSDLTGLISNHYVTLEIFLMEKNVQKAIQINERNGVISSMVDDVFYVLWASIRRAISTSDTTCVDRVLKRAADLLTGVYSDAVKPSVEAYMVNVGVQQTLTEFATALNNFEVSIEYTSKLISRIKEQIREACKCFYL